MAGRDTVGRRDQNREPDFRERSGQKGTERERDSFKKKVCWRRGKQEGCAEDSSVVQWGRGKSEGKECGKVAGGDYVCRGETGVPKGTPLLVGALH